MSFLKYIECLAKAHDLESPGGRSSAFRAVNTPSSWCPHLKLRLNVPWNDQSRAVAHAFTLTALQIRRETAIARNRGNCDAAPAMQNNLSRG